MKQALDMVSGKNLDHKVLLHRKSREWPFPYIPLAYRKLIKASNFSSAIEKLGLDFFVSLVVFVWMFFNILLSTNNFQHS